MLKTFGVLLMSLSVWYLGNGFSKKLRQKMDCEDAIISLVVFIKSKIVSHSAPVCDICADFYDARLDIGRFYELLSQMQSDSLSKALCEISTKECETTILDSAKEFACSVGFCCCAQEAVSLCDRYISDMQAKLSSVRTADKKRSELYSKLAVICALSVFVLCI
ncbi:MAG: hypothetical protein E7656_00995 [Ruminococcaceae bacterium]|nr:hypothetical protein [Oscillospiraceae bacterium]